MHGRVINYSDIDSLPCRNNFLDGDRKREVDRIIENNEPLSFIPAAIAENSLPTDVDNKYSKWRYKLILFGTFQDGRSATVIIDDIEPYVYVRIPDEFQESTTKRYLFKSELEGDMNRQRISCEEMHIVKKKEFLGFDKEAYFVKVVFSKVSGKARREALKLFDDKKWKTATDDKTKYYKIPIRDRKSTISSWIKLKKYTVDEDNPYFKDKFVYHVSMDDIEPHTSEEILSSPALSRDYSMVMGWDIECASKTGALSVPENKDDIMFMICISFQWHFAKNQLLKVCLVDHPSNAHPDFLTIVCGSEKNVIKAFALLFELMTPEYMMGFNDSGFDWPWFVARAWKYSVQQGPNIGDGVMEFIAQKMDRMVKKKHYYRDMKFKSWLSKEKKRKDFKKIYMSSKKLKTLYNAYLAFVIGDYKKEIVKIAADDNEDGFFLQYRGYIAFDVRIIFKQLHPTSEKSSLNYFLGMYNLKNKEDMAIQKMFKIYWDMTRVINSKNDDSKEMEGLKNDMRDVANYCVVDAQSCPGLTKVRNIIPDRREVANLSFVSVSDAFFRANGMKMRNIVIAEGQDKGYVFSNLHQKEKDEDKYPGALVLNPKTGLYVPKLTLKERVDKFNEFIEFQKDGYDFDEPYSLRELPHKDLISVKDVHSKIEALETAVAQSGSSGVGLSKTEAKKIVSNAGITGMESNIFANYLMEDTGRPVTGLDFSSLYPHLMMTYNLSPEYMICKQTCNGSIRKMAEKASKAIKQGYTLHKIQFKYGNQTIKGFSVRHDNHIDMENPNSERNRFGIYPTVLKKLYDKRSIMKKPAKYYEMLVEHFEKLNDDIKKNNKIVEFIKNRKDIFEQINDWDGLIELEDSFGYARRVMTELNKEKMLKFVIKEPITFFNMGDAIEFVHKRTCSKDAKHFIRDKEGIEKVLNYESKTIDIDEMERLFAYYSSKQIALKVMMNTLYGESGSKNSPFYVLCLAGGITTAGRYNLELVRDVCLKEKCGIIYGDSDSVYITVPEEHFAEIDNRYYSGKMSKLEYCNKLVNITFREIKKINKYANECLKKDNGTEFLRLAFEEVIFPGVFLSKKKYYGLPHVSVPNFNVDRTPFIRGIEAKKRGTSEILKRVYIDKIMSKSLSIYNKEELVELVYKAIHYFYESEWNINDFVQTAIYKPKTEEEILQRKGNTKVLTFVARMKNRNIEVTPHERFKYVIVKKYPNAHNYRGVKKELKVGERMEFLHIAKKNNMPMDVDYYMKGNIITQLARVMIYRREFYVEPVDTSDEEIKKANDKMVKQAKTHLTEFIINKGFYDLYHNMGPIKQRIFRETEKIITNKFNKIHSSDMGKSLFRDWCEDPGESFQKMYDKINILAKKESANYGDELVSVLKKRNKEQTKAVIMKNLKRTYGDVKSVTYNQFMEFKDRYVFEIENKFRELFKMLMNMVGDYRNTVDLISKIIDDVISPCYSKYYEPISEKNDGFDEVKKMQIEEIAKKSNKTIPYEFLDDLAEDSIYDMGKTHDVSDILEELTDIQCQLNAVLYMYHQTKSISDSIVLYNDKKLKTQVTLYEQPEVIAEHKKMLISLEIPKIKDY